MVGYDRLDIVIDESDASEGGLSDRCPLGAKMDTSQQVAVIPRNKEVTVAPLGADGDLEPALQELSQLLRTTIEHMRESATRLLVEGTPLPEPRRRANDNEV